MAYGKRVVVLQGRPIYHEGGKASAQVNPGYLVKGVTTVAHQNADKHTPVAKQFAVERDEFGTGIDGTYVASPANSGGTGNYYYSSGDQVKVAVCEAGVILTAFLASGETVVEDDVLENAGDGTLKKLEAYTSGSGACYPIARALEAITGAQGIVKIKIEVL